MVESNILNEVSKKEINAEILAKKVIKNPRSLPDIMEGFLSDAANIRFKSAKILVLISKEKSELLLPYFNFFAGHLGNKNTILKWNAMDVISNLAPADSEKKFDKLFKKFYSMLYEGSLITAAHVVEGSAIIANTKPYLEEKITQEILKIGKIPLPSEECRNILKGHAIKAFDQYFDQSRSKDKIIDFVRKELNNTRNATRKKAEKFLKKWER
ncbi:MAG: hypothetical protein GTO16_13930 [Candidatus Aminicenantes bacterium]|nr:hypothetical protein [Candidatus Aminicenantes bacterium]